MKQDFFNLEIKTNGQNLYEFTDQTIDWIEKNKFKSDVLNNSLALNVFNNEDNYNFKKQIKIIESLSENSPILICLSGDKKNNSFCHFNFINE